MEGTAVGVGADRRIIEGSDSWEGTRQVLSLFGIM